MDDQRGPTPPGLLQTIVCNLRLRPGTRRVRRGRTCGSTERHNRAAKFNLSPPLTAKRQRVAVFRAGVMGSQHSRTPRTGHYSRRTGAVPGQLAGKVITWRRIAFQHQAGKVAREPPGMPFGRYPKPLRMPFECPSEGLRAARKTVPVTGARRWSARWSATSGTKIRKSLQDARLAVTKTRSARWSGAGPTQRVRDRKSARPYVA